jgi:serine protease inhibitor
MSFFRRDNALQPAQLSKSYFAVNLFRRLCTGTNNAVLSPYSVWLLLALVSEGASGDTRDELLALLGCANDAPASKHLDPICFGEVILNIATGIWTHLDFPIHQCFRETARVFGAEATSLDFSSPEAPRTINKWASANTRGKIPQVTEALNRDHRLFLANAIYFKGNWQDPFNDFGTHSQSFHRADGSVTQVQMMHRRADRLFYEHRSVQYVLLPYAGSSLAMVIGLPHSANDIGALTQSLKPDYLDHLLGHMKKRDVELHLPRFNVGVHYELSPVLKNMGAHALFSSKAGLDGISESPLFASSVVQSALCEINESGTVAAAVTTMPVPLSSRVPRIDLHIRMIVDHPFHFAIFDQESRNILFMGSVFDPT